MKKLFLVWIAFLLFAVAPATVGPNQTLASTVQKKEKVERTVYITRTGEKYHRGTCHHLRRSKFAIKLSDAIAQGYEPCKVCRP
jgi:hypothetical protein